MGVFRDSCKQPFGLSQGADPKSLEIIPTIFIPEIRSLS